MNFQGYRQQCNACAYQRYRNSHRERNLIRNYGMTLADYDRMLEEQGGGCKICGTTDPGGRSDKFHIDHDHATGLVRGLLCAGCNLAIGHLREDPHTARLLAEYLEYCEALMYGRH